MLLHNLNTLTLILNLSLKITQTQGLRCDPPKLRFENHTNKKTLKQAWRFFLLYRFIRDRDRIRTYDRLLRRQMLYPAELRDLTKNPCKSIAYKGVSGETGIRTQATLSR